MFTVIFANWWKKTSFRWQKLFFWQDSFFLFFSTRWQKHANPG